MKNLLIRSSFLMILLVQATYAETNENFDTAPGWTRSNNPFEDNDFGFQNSNVAGGTPGEAGGFFSVATLPVWYGDESIDTLGANDRVDASGILHIASVDSAYNNNVFIGHFDAGVFSTPGVNGIGFQLLESSAQMGSSEFRIWISIGDDAFLAFTITSSLGLTRTWSYSYNPNGDLFGALTISISGPGGGTLTHSLTSDQRNSIGSLDTFGMATVGIALPPNSAQVELYLDNLVYSNNPDRDLDGVLDIPDNCPTTANPGQADADLNGVGDLCEIGARQTFSDGGTPAIETTLAGFCVDCIVNGWWDGGQGMVVQGEDGPGDNALLFETSGSNFHILTFDPYFNADAAFLGDLLAANVEAVRFRARHAGGTDDIVLRAILLDPFDDDGTDWAITDTDATIATTATSWQTYEISLVESNLTTGTRLFGTGFVPARRTVSEILADVVQFGLRHDPAHTGPGTPVLTDSSIEIDDIELIIAAVDVPGDECADPGGCDLGGQIVELPPGVETEGVTITRISTTEPTPGDDGVNTTVLAEGRLFVPPFMRSSSPIQILEMDSNLVIESGTILVTIEPGDFLDDPLPCDSPIPVGVDPQLQDIVVWQTTDASEIAEGRALEITSDCGGSSRGRTRGLSFFVVGLHLDCGVDWFVDPYASKKVKQCFADLTHTKFHGLIGAVIKSKDVLSRRDYRKLIRLAFWANIAFHWRFYDAAEAKMTRLINKLEDIEFETSDFNNSGNIEMRAYNVRFMITKIQNIIVNANLR